MNKVPRFSAGAGILAIALALFCIPDAKADPIAAYTTTNPTSLDGNYIVGFEFTPTSTFDISALGYWDKDHNGLQSSHQIAIYYATTGGGHTAGELVAGTLVTVQIADSGSSLDIGNNTDGWYAYHNLGANVTLQTGVQYVLAADTDGIGSLGEVQFDPLAYQSLGTPTITAPITTGFGRYANNPSPYGENVFYPTTVDTTYFYSTPNFLVAASVPEPSGSALLSIGGAVFLVWRMRRGIASL